MVRAAARDDRLEPGQHRGLATGAADDGGGGDIADQPRIDRGLLLADHRLHRVDARVAGERLDRIADHRLAADQRILLGQRPARARTGAAGDDDGDGAGRGSRHCRRA